jgi:uncharacterized membrane protein YbhN (UPF0104 family)
MKWLKKLFRVLPALLGVCLLAGAIYVVQKEFRNLKIADISKALDAIPHLALVVSFFWTVLSYGVLTFYDRLGTIYAGNVVSYTRVAFASFCAYALSHNLGVAAVSGAAVRYRLYAHWGLTPLQIGKVVAFCSLTFGLGAGVLGGLILFTEPEAVPFFGNTVPLPILYGVGALLWLLVTAYVMLAKFLGTIRLFGHEVELPHWKMALLQVVLATVDVAVTAAIMHALLPPAPGLNYLRFLGVYLASYTAGLAANVPGGLGVFDTAMLLGLSPYLEPPQILGAIVVFRLYYYIIPLFLAGGLFTGNEILLRGKGFMAGAARLVGVDSLKSVSEPDFAVTAATGAVVLCGALLLSIGVIEARPDFSWIDPDFAEVAETAGEFLPSLIGAALIVLALKLAQRVSLAWGATIVLLLVAAGYTAAQGERFWVPGLLVASAILLMPFRSAFYRRARVFSGPIEASTALPLLALAVCVLLLAAFEPHIRWLDNDSWWKVILSPDVPNSLRASVAFTVAIGLVAIGRLLHPSRVQALAWTPDTRLRYAALGAMPPVDADGLVWGESNRAAIAYRKLDGVILALGDPVGAPGDQTSAIWRLRDLAAQDGMEAAVWRAGPRLLKIYADLGLSALRLGPDGMPDQSDAEPPTANARYLVCKVERNLKTLLPILPDLVEREAESAD